MLAALVPFILPHKHSVHDNDSPVPNRKRSAPLESQDDLAGDSSSDEEGHYLSPMEESEDEAESLSMHDVYSDHEEEEESSCMMLEDLHSHRRFNLLAELPTEILFHVLQYLSPRHLLSLRLANRWLHQVCGDDHLWHGFVRSRWPSPRHYGSTQGMADESWAQAYERMEWNTNRPVVLKGWLYDFPSLFAAPLELSRDSISAYRRERHYATEMAQQEEEEVLQVQFFLSHCSGPTQRREKKATVWYSNDKLGRAWNKTLADVSGGVRPPLKALTHSTVVISINTTLVGLDKCTGQELWRHKLFCNYLVAAKHEDRDIVYAVGCDDMVYEGRIVVRERPLVALDARTGCELWRADLLPLSNDMRCEPSKPVVLSPDYLLTSIEDFPPCPSSSLIVSAKTGAVSLVVKGEVTACVHANDKLVMIKDGRGSCHTLAGEQVWELSKTFSGRVGAKGGILPLQDGSFVFYHYSHVIDAVVQVVLVNAQGQEEWWLECGGATNGTRKIYHSINAEVRGEAGILLTCESAQGCWVHLVSWEGKTVFRWEKEESLNPSHHWVL